MDDARKVLLHRVKNICRACFLGPASTTKLLRFAAEQELVSNEKLNPLLLRRIVFKVERTCKCQSMHLLYAFDSIACAAEAADAALR